MKDNNIKINDFFHDLEIIGSAADDISKFYAMHKKLFNNSEKECKIDVNKSPILLTSSDTKNAYKNANFKQIEKIVKDSDDDTRAIYTNIKDNGVKAWTKVSSGGKEFYMSFSNKASIWCMTEKTEKILTKEGDIKYSAVVQMGIYSSSGQIAGINTYNITLPILLGEVVSALLVARLISFAIAEGASFLIASILSRMGAFAVEIGLGPVSFIIGSYALSAVVASLIFAIVFVGIMYLWNWVNKKYTIKLQIFNWDENYIWNIVDDYLLNAKLANDEHNREHDFYISLPKMIKPNETITPPGFNPIVPLDSICHYCIFIFENDSTFLQGCSFVLKIQKDKNSEGFMYAFECPRFSDNKQAADDGITQPKYYYENVKWNNNPISFNIQSTKDKTPVSFQLDALRGAKNDTYNVLININKK